MENELPIVHQCEGDDSWHVSILDTSGQHMTHDVDITEAYNAGIEAALGALPEKMFKNHGDQWNSCIDEARAAIENLHKDSDTYTGSGESYTGEERRK